MVKIMEQNEEMTLSTQEVKDAISEVITEMRTKHEEARMKSPTGELKRNPFDNLDERGLMSSEYIVKEWDNIQAKKSSHSSSERRLLSQIVWLGLRKAAIKKARDCENNNNSKTEENE